MPNLPLSHRNKVKKYRKVNYYTSTHFHRSKFLQRKNKLQNVTIITDEGYFLGEKVIPIGKREKLSVSIEISMAIIHRALITYYRYFNMKSKKPTF